MKIATWNIRHGGGKRISLIFEEIANNSDTDVFVLTEFRNNQNTAEIESRFNDLGYTFQYFTHSDSKLNSVFVASKSKFELAGFAELDEHPQRVLKLSNAECSIYACYFPLKKEKAAVFDFLLEQKAAGVENMIIAGDFNTGRHYIDEEKATFYCSEYFDKLENMGLRDAWRAIHGDKREYSWYSNFGNGFRLDHFYIAEELVQSITDCYYLHECREKKIGDHSMMILELNGDQ